MEADGVVEDDCDILAEAVAVVLGLVEAVVLGDALVVVVGVGDGEGQTAHSVALGVKSSHKLNCKRPVCCRHVARRAVVVALHGPPFHVATQYVSSSAPEL